MKLNQLELQLKEKLNYETPGLTNLIFFNKTKLSLWVELDNEEFDIIFKRNTNISCENIRKLKIKIIKIQIEIKFMKVKD